MEKHRSPQRPKTEVWDIFFGRKLDCTWHVPLNLEKETFWGQKKVKDKDFSIENKRKETFPFSYPADVIHYINNRRYCGPLDFICLAII